MTPDLQCSPVFVVSKLEPWQIAGSQLKSLTTALGRVQASWCILQVKHIDKARGVTA